VSARAIETPRRTVVIESVEPAVDGGRYPVKREVGAVLEVSADIFKDGHDVLVAYLRHRRDGDRAWFETPMRFVDNDRWAGAFTLAATGRYRYTVEALTEPFLSWLADLEKRHAGGQDLASALGEGLALIRAAAGRATSADRSALAGYADRIERAPAASDAVAVASDPALADLDDPVSRSKRSDVGRPRARGDRRPGARAVRRMVRVLPPLGHGRRSERHVQGSRGAARARRGDGVRHRLPAADPPDRPGPP
jgi:hypothetical protein